MNEFFNNLFGTIAYGGASLRVPANADFIPTDSSGKTLKIRKKSQASWLGLKSPYMQKYAYEYCYPLASVVDRLAEYDLTGEFQILRSTGKGKENFATSAYANDLNKLFAQPNPLQSWEQFRGQQIAYKKVFGFCPVLPIMPGGIANDPSMCITMMNLPPWLFRAIPNTSASEYSTKIEEIVERYECTIYGKTIKLKPSQVFILEDSFWQNDEQNLLLPLSRLVGLDMAVSNLCAGMEADNVLLKKKGPLGFISHDAATKDAASYIPMSKLAKKVLQRELANYGMSWNQFQYVVSRQAAKWNPMSYNVKELGTKETVVAAEKAICHRLAFPYVLYEETDTTYANGDNAAATVYATNVIPNNRKDYKKYEKFFKAAENNCSFYGNFESVEALQEDKLMEAQRGNQQTQALQVEWVNNIITLNEWRIARGYDTKPDGDIYYKDLKTNSDNGNQDPTQQDKAA